MLKKKVISKALLLSIMMISGCSNSATYHTKAYNKKWLAVLNKAKEEKEYTIVNFSTTWCMPCKILEKEVLEDDSVAGFLKQKIQFLTVDAEKDLGLRLAMKFSISLFPTLLIFDPRGMLVYEKTGIDKINTPDAFLDLIGNVIKGKNILPANGLPPKLLALSDYPKFYTDYFMHKKQPDSELIATYFKQQKDMYSEVNWAVIRVFGNNNSIQKFLTQHANKYIDLYGCMVNERLAKSIRTSLTHDFDTKDSSHFKMGLNAYLKLKEDLSGRELIKRKYLLTLNYWEKTGLGGWSRFLSYWKEYREYYGTDLDLRAAKMIDERCMDQDIRNFAKQVLQQRIKENPQDWRGIVGLANLLQREDISNENKDGRSVIYSNQLFANTTMPQAEKLYLQAIKEAGDSRDSTLRIVYMRIQSANFVPNEKTWWAAMAFYKKYLPTDYEKYYRFHTAGYYDEQKNWAKFIQYVNAFCKQLGGFENIHRTNAHLYSMYAQKILDNSKGPDQIKTAIDWMNGLIKNNPNNFELQHYIEIRKSLHQKLKSLNNQSLITKDS